MVEQSVTQVTRTNGTTRRWDPFGMLQSLQHEMDANWHHPFMYAAGPWPTVFPPLKGIGKTFAPRTDVFEKGNVLIFKVEMPGITKEDVSVELYEGDLVIKGAAKAGKEVNETACYAGSARTATSIAAYHSHSRSNPSRSRQR